MELSTLRSKACTNLLINQKGVAKSLVRKQPLCPSRIFIDGFWLNSHSFMQCFTAPLVMIKNHKFYLSYTKVFGINTCAISNVFWLVVTSCYENLAMYSFTEVIYLSQLFWKSVGDFSRGKLFWLEFSLTKQTWRMACSSNNCITGACELHT